MTWVANFTVTKVTKKKDNTTLVTAECTHEEEFIVRYAHGEHFEKLGLDYVGDEQLLSAKLELLIDGETHIEEGDVLNASGHFDVQNVIKRVTEDLETVPK